MVGLIEDSYKMQLVRTRFPWASRRKPSTDLNNGENGPP